MVGSCIRLLRDVSLQRTYKTTSLNNKQMSVIFKVYQNSVINFKNKGRWNHRACHLGIVDTKELADAIRQNVSVKRSDVYAMLMKLANAVRDGITKKRSVSLLKGIKVQSAPEYPLPADVTYNP
jgi:hypothetical protein